MRGRRRGPTPRPVDPRVKQLDRLQRKLQRAETIITLQKKVAEILIPLTRPTTTTRRRLRAIEASFGQATAALDACQTSGCPGRRSIDVGAPRHLHPHSAPRRRRARWAPPNARPLECCTACDQSPAEVRHVAEEQTYLCSPVARYRGSRRPTKCASGAPRPSIRCTRNPSSWRRARIRSGPGTSPSSLAGPDPVSLLLALCDPRPLQPLRRGLDGHPSRRMRIAGRALD